MGTWIEHHWSDPVSWVILLTDSWRDPHWFLLLSFQTHPLVSLDCSVIHLILWESQYAFNLFCFSTYIRYYWSVLHVTVVSDSWCIHLPMLCASSHFAKLDTGYVSSPALSPRKKANYFVFNFSNILPFDYINKILFSVQWKWFKCVFLVLVWFCFPAHTQKNFYNLTSLILKHYSLISTWTEPYYMQIG